AGPLLKFTGGGDVKLLAVVGSLIGPQMVFSTFIFSIFIAALIALAYSVYSWAFRGSESPVARYGLMLASFVATRRLVYIRPDEGEALGQRFPLAPAIAIGSIVATLIHS
ncbi:MAG TPA: prepilin peptidase, partial [Myxococcales bacterium]|nr:prepilin peptidase [Myxococcales bacterium]